jgi:probable rRNA maturation factor
MLYVDNQTSIQFHAKPLEAIMASLTDKEVELIIVNEATMRTINLENRGVDTSTDVLSFPISPFPHAPLGTIVINEAASSSAAEAFGHTLEEEFSLLFIHGLLHLLGFDHETDQGEMRKKEEVLIVAFNLPQSLIVRTESA